MEDIEKSIIRMEEFVKGIKEDTDKICSVMYGNGKDGIVTKVSNLFTILKVYGGLIMFVFMGIAGIFFYVIKKG